MQKIFLSFHFDDPRAPTSHDRKLADTVESLIGSHGLVTVTGDTLGGQSLSAGVKKQIEDSDALIALMTRRGEAIPGRNPPEYQTHPWVIDEYGYADNNNRPVISLVEEGIPVGGMRADRERIPYSRDLPLDAIVRLSSTIGKWKRDAGRMVSVQLLPQEIAVSLGNAGDLAQCEYRRVSRGTPPTAWIKTLIYPEPGGTFIFVNGMNENTLIQVRAVINGVEHVSQQTSEFVPVVLKSRQNGGGV